MFVICNVEKRDFETLPLLTNLFLDFPPPSGIKFQKSVSHGQKNKKTLIFCIQNFLLIFLSKIYEKPWALGALSLPRKKYTSWKEATSNTTLR